MFYERDFPTSRGSRNFAPDESRGTIRDDAPIGETRFADRGGAKLVSNFHLFDSHSREEALEIDFSRLEKMRAAKLLESSHAWLGASTSSIAADYTTLLKLKAPTWTRHDLQEAIEAVVTQKMRFTQASTKYGIPKGTLYDNILGKSKRMMVLEEAGLNTNEETAVLEFCCDISVSPYNRRTKKSLNAILNFVEKLRRKRDPGFVFTGLSGFRWWWAFCKKHSIVSLYFNDENENE
ncbi:hypothetical protein KM043_010501 [Ampulex compressa]|nr:hypothetical protein KM043_010501 [Ampulex compressa]